MKIILLGSSITSSRKSDYATTYRCLVDELATRGHDVLFLERRIPLPHLQIDIPQSHHGRSQFYDSLDDLKRRFTTEIDRADCVIMDSLVSEGHALSTWLKSTATGMTAFLDLTPAMARINSGSSYDLHLSAGFTPHARSLFPCADPLHFYPETEVIRWDLGHPGFWVRERESVIEELLVGPARAWKEGRFVIAANVSGRHLELSPNIDQAGHFPTTKRREFLNSQYFALATGPADAHLFEAAACATPVITQYWKGLELLFEPGKEILVVDTAEDVLRILRDTRYTVRAEIGWAARRRVLRHHTAANRAQALEQFIHEAMHHALHGGVARQVV